MNYYIVTEYSSFLLFPIVLLSVFLVYLQYFKSKQVVDKNKIYILSFLRFVSYILLGFVLLNPQVKYTKEKLIKPDLIWLQDVSKSVISSKDSSYYKNKYFKNIIACKNKLSNKYNIVNLEFSDNVNSGVHNYFSGLHTNISGAIAYVKNNFYYSDNSLLVLSSDGIYNKGNNPRYTASDINIPIYTLILGDTTLVKDLAVTKVISNKIAFLNNKLPVEVKINAKLLEGSKSVVRIYNKGKLLASRVVSVRSNDYFHAEKFFLDLKNAGLQTFYVSVDIIKGERNVSNNKMSFAVDVLDHRRKILMLFDLFHPDISAIKGAVESDSDFEFVGKSYSEFNGELSKYNMVIIYQPKRMCASVVSKCNKLKIPILYILGTYSDLDFVNENSLGYSVNNRIAALDDIQFSINDKFDLFVSSKEDEEIFSNMPPLNAPFGKLKFSEDIEILAYQKIKSIKTDKPLVAFWDNNDAKNAIIYGEGLWKWKYYNFMKENNSNAFNRMINNICKYLSLIKQKDKLILDYKRIFNSSSKVYFKAEVYNKSFQRINSTDLNIKIFGANKLEFIYEFVKTSDYYDLSIDDLPVGGYSFVCYDNNKLKQKGSFVIVESNVEANNLLSDYKLMQKISMITNANSYFVSNINMLVDDLLKENKFKSKIRPLVNYIRLFSFKLFLMLLVLFIGLEWFLRKIWSL